MKIIIFTLLLAATFCQSGCGQQSKPNSTTQQDQFNSVFDTTHTDTEAEVIVDSIASKSLNEIRFGKWTENDWYDNDYFRFLRQIFDDYLAGKVEMDRLVPHKSLLKSKFVILEASEFINGGLFVDLIFIDAPEKVFTTNIYSDVDEVSETITGYSIRGFQLNEGDSGFTKEEILRLIKEHPENKLW